MKTTIYYLAGLILASLLGLSHVNAVTTDRDGKSCTEPRGLGSRGGFGHYIMPMEPSLPSWEPGPKLKPWYDPHQDTQIHPLPRPWEPEETKPKLLPWIHPPPEYYSAVFDDESLGSPPFRNRWRWRLLPDKSRVIYG